MPFYPLRWMRQCSQVKASLCNVRVYFANRLDYSMLRVKSLMLAGSELTSNVASSNYLTKQSYV